MNIDAHGRVLSYGNSFHPGGEPSLDIEIVTRPSSETARLCENLQATLEAHQAELANVRGDQGPWRLVKAAAQVVLPGLVKSDSPIEVDQQQVKKIQRHMTKVQHHIDALCGEGVNALSLDDEQYFTPIDALISLIPKISSQSASLQANLSSDDFEITPHHTLTPKPAPAEPPTQDIHGVGLAKSGVVSKVPARLMYTQTSEGAPRIVWKLEVEMKDNWYEAYVDVKTGELLRIVDWTNDYSWDTPSSTEKQVEVMKGGKQHPLPVPPKHMKPYTYQVFPWGGSLTMLEGSC